MRAPRVELWVPWGEEPLSETDLLMTWLVLSLLSAVLLGLYDFLKKSALRDNAVMPVLFGLGIILLKEKHVLAKGVCVLGILAGVFLLA